MMLKQIACNKHYRTNVTQVMRNQNEHKIEKLNL